MAFNEFPSLFDPTEFGKSLPLQIAEFIAGEIFSGRFATGDHLKETELAKMFHTSRAPVREALYLLQIEGLVERLPRRGTVVRAYEDKELLELYDVRVGLECMALERLRDTWDIASEEKFDAVLMKMDVALRQSDADEYAQLNDRFHQLLFELSGNSMLWRIYHQLKNLMVIILQASTQESQTMETSLQEHRQIVEALTQGDFELARERLVTNIRHGMDRALKSRGK